MNSASRIGMPIAELALMIQPVMAAPCPAMNQRIDPPVRAFVAEISGDCSRELPQPREMLTARRDKTQVDGFGQARAAAWMFVMIKV
jgi:hypothetical protein